MCLRRSKGRTPPTTHTPPALGLCHSSCTRRLDHHRSPRAPHADMWSDGRRITYEEGSQDHAVCQVPPISKSQTTSCQEARAHQLQARPNTGLGQRYPAAAANIHPAWGLMGTESGHTLQIHLETPQPGTRDSRHLTSSCLAPTSPSGSRSPSHTNASMQI